MAPDLLITVMGDPEPSDAEIVALARLLLAEVEQDVLSPEQEKEAA